MLGESKQKEIKVILLGVMHESEPASRFILAENFLHRLLRVTTTLMAQKIRSVSQESDRRKKCRDRADFKGLLSAHMMLPDNYRTQEALVNDWWGHYQKLESYPSHEVGIYYTVLSYATELAKANVIAASQLLHKLTHEFQRPFLKSTFESFKKVVGSNGSRTKVCVDPVRSFLIALAAWVDLEKILHPFEHSRSMLKCIDDNCSYDVGSRLDDGGRVYKDLNKYSYDDWDGERLLYATDLYGGRYASYEICYCEKHSKTLNQHLTPMYIEKTAQLFLSTLQVLSDFIAQHVPETERDQWLLPYEAWSKYCDELAALDKQRMDTLKQLQEEGDPTQCMAIEKTCLELDKRLAACVEQKQQLLRKLSPLAKTIFSAWINCEFPNKWRDFPGDSYFEEAKKIFSKNAAVLEFLTARQHQVQIRFQKHWRELVNAVVIPKDVIRESLRSEARFKEDFAQLRSAYQAFREHIGVSLPPELEAAVEQDINYCFGGDLTSAATISREEKIGTDGPLKAPAEKFHTAPAALALAFASPMAHPVAIIIPSAPPADTGQGADPAEEIAELPEGGGAEGSIGDEGPDIAQMLARLPPAPTDRLATPVSQMRDLTVGRTKKAAAPAL